MGGIVKEVLMAMVENDDMDRRFVSADSVHLLDDVKVGLGSLSEVFKHVDQLDLAHAVVVPGSWKGFQVMSKIWTAVLVNIDVVVKMALTAAQIEFERLHVFVAVGIRCCRHSPVMSMPV